MKKLIILLMLPLCICCKGNDTYHITPYDNFYVNKEKYKLDKVLILSRHGIRAPLVDQNSILGKITNHEWHHWTCEAKHLTLKGGTLETMLGQYVRQYLINNDFMKDNMLPSDPDLSQFYFYANSIQRTVATSQYFSSGMLPLANAKINYKTDHKFDNMDPIFNPATTFTSSSYVNKVKEDALNVFNSKKSELKECYESLENVLDYKDTQYAKDKMPHFNVDDFEMNIKKDDEPSFKDETSLKTANIASDALELQYYEEPDDYKAALNHNIGYTTWEKLAKISNIYEEILFTDPIVAANCANPMLKEIQSELNNINHKFTFLCGHDSNISTVTSSLDVTNYSLINTISKRTPIGSKLMFERWVNKQSNEKYYSLSLLYQRLDQLRNLTYLDFEHPPVKYELSLNNLNKNEDHLYKENDFISRLNSSINKYDEIKKDFPL